jgi:uncharacterized integral membrane protein
MSTMTEPTDETQPHEIPAVIPPPPGPASAAAAPDPALGSAATETGAGANVGAPPPTPPLRADPDRPPTAWREPPWVPPAPVHRRGPSAIAVIAGLIILAVGLYYFVDRTLGIDLPAVSWGSLWPLILIAIGGVILIRAWDRDR